MSDTPAPGIISTAYDIDAHPDADEFDPEAWFEGTGEDLGLPEGYLEQDARDMEAGLAFARELKAEIAKSPPQT